MFSMVVTAMQSSVLPSRKIMTNFQRRNFSAISSLNYTLHVAQISRNTNSHYQKFSHTIEVHPINTILSITAASVKLHSKSFSIC